MARIRPASLDEKDLALLNEAPRAFDRSGWLFELKYDGFRILALREGVSVRLLTRKGNDLAASFPEIVAELARLPECAIDGELVVLDAEGIPQFDALAARGRKVQKKAVTAAAREQPAVLFAFDLLVDGGEDLRRRPLLERKATLAKRLAGMERVRYLEHIVDEGKALFDAARRLGMEGIVAKNGASVYRAGRSRDWLKIKTPLGRQRTEERGDAWYEGGTASDRAEALLEGDDESASVTIEGHALELTRLNKVFWPATKNVRAFTKRDYLSYLLRAARPIVAHLSARPLTLLLMPDGLGGRRVLEMHWAREVPGFVDTV